MAALASTRLGLVDRRRHEGDLLGRQHFAGVVRQPYGQADLRLGACCTGTLMYTSSAALSSIVVSSVAARDAIALVNRNVADDAGGRRRDLEVAERDSLLADLLVDRLELRLGGLLRGGRLLVLLLAARADVEQALAR